MSHREKNQVSRRRFLSITVAAAAAAAMNGVVGFVRAAEVPHLTDSDPMAQALGYVEDATTTNNALYKAGSRCADCTFYTGAATGYGSCQLFPGKLVNAKGWCSSYTAKKA